MGHKSKGLWVDGYSQVRINAMQGRKRLDQKASQQQHEER